MLVVAMIGLTACDYDTQIGTLSTLLTWMQIGNSQDQWLEQKSGLTNEWDRVALVFAFYDDYDACSDLADAMRVKFPLGEFRCVPAN